MVPGPGSEFHRPTPGQIEVVFQAYVSGGSGDYTVSYNQNPVILNVLSNPSGDTFFATTHAVDNVTGHTGDALADYHGFCP